jgi:hypothetical protein
MPHEALARDYVRNGLQAWAPNWPRRVTQHQRTANNAPTAASMLMEAERNGTAPFISTYSFPRGHTKGDHIPTIDTLFIDFDFEGGDYEGDGDREAWRRDLSHLLVRTRAVADFLLDEGAETWRAALSGHKGVHLFHDFAALDENIGEFSQYVQGMNDYATRLVGDLADETGLTSLHKYVDVTSSDLGRLCRAPNTLHHSATEAFDDERYCVPVSIEELAEIDVDAYEDLTSSRRPSPVTERTERQDTTHIEQHIRSASVHRQTGGRSATVDWSRVNRYRNESDDELTLDDVEFLLHDRTCMWNWHLRPDKFDYGFQSHYMEIASLTELIHHRVPIDVLHEFLQPSPKYDEQRSDNTIRQLVAYHYNKFSPQSIRENAPEFADPENCPRCKQALEEAHA